MFDAVFLAKILHGQFAFTAIDRLEGTGLVVNARMQHSRIVSGLVFGQRRFFFHDNDPLARVTFEEPIGRCQANDTPPDDANIGFQNCLISRP